MPIVPLSGCLQVLELGEHPCPVTVNSHEIEGTFVVAIIQIMLIKELLSTMTAIQ